jgi:hypothetical protein
MKGLLSYLAGSMPAQKPALVGMLYTEGPQVDEKLSTTTKSQQDQQLTSLQLTFDVLKTCLYSIHTVRGERAAI